jgi:hypothetical protein
MRQQLLILTALLSASCALPERQLVDEDGLPLQGVLVMSSFPGDMLFGGACATACLTDADGYAPVASRDDFVAIMPGYHTWTRWGHDDRGRSTLAAEGASVVMHRRSKAVQPEVHVSQHEVTFITDADEVQLVPLPSEIGVTLELLDRTDFRARASGECLLRSARFYFAGPGRGSWEATLDQVDDLFFYVRTATGRFFKVGVTRDHNTKSTRRLEVGGLMRQVPTDMLTILWVDLGSEMGVVEPPVQQVRAPWIWDSAELILGDAACVLAALDAAVRRGDVEDGESYLRWLARLRAASLRPPGERQP